MEMRNRSERKIEFFLNSNNLYPCRQLLAEPERELLRCATWKSFLCERMFVPAGEELETLKR